MRFSSMVSSMTASRQIEQEGTAVSFFFLWRLTVISMVNKTNHTKGGNHHATINETRTKTFRSRHRSRH